MIFEPYDIIVVGAGHAGCEAAAAAAKNPSRTLKKLAEMCFQSIPLFILSKASVRMISGAGMLYTLTSPKWHTYSQKSMTKIGNARYNPIHPIFLWSDLLFIRSND